MKISMIAAIYFWDVAAGSLGMTSGGNMHHSGHVASLSHRIDNNLSEIEEFSQLEENIRNLIGRYDIKGASIAVTKDEKLVYAKGIGYADKERGEKVEPSHRFRLASVSKLITAITIMKMHEEGLLDIDDRVFGTEGILNDSLYGDYADTRVENIRVRHLLNHSGGWNRRFGDHMFMPDLVAREMNADKPVEVSDIIRFALSKRLHFTPGSRTSYSNLGYAILGKVIEKVSGESYESYVRSFILEPLGIYNMEIGSSMYSGENEVTYYEHGNIPKALSICGSGEKVMRSYGGNDIEALGAAGGWIAPPSEIMKLIVAVDGNPHVPDILSEESIELMTNPSFSGGHTFGWRGTNGRGRWWRTGTFAGTFALVMRQNNGINWMVAFNTSTWKGSAIASEVRWEVQTGLNSVGRWPDYDLFYHFDNMPFIYNNLASN